MNFDATPKISLLIIDCTAFCTDNADEDGGLDMYGGDPVLPRAAGSSDGEQEVPLGSDLCQGASISTAKKKKG